MVKIRIVIDNVNKHILIYDHRLLEKYGQIPSLKEDDFYHYMKHFYHKVDIAYIPIQVLYRNILYALYPNIKIIIDKEELAYLFGASNLSDMYEAEVATTAEEEEQMLSPSEFIIRFYEQKTLADAKELYEWWQLNIPIQDHSLYRYIRMIEYFDKEIFNYFDV